VTRWGLKEETVRKLREVFSRFPEITEVRIFGSRALGNFKPGSDVDLALYGKGPLRCATRVSTLLNQELPLPYHFDVVDYAFVERPEFREHIDRVSQPIYHQ
jgi:predicted nucleotidyltransferase